MHLFHQQGPTLSSGVLIVMHFGTPKVYFNKLKVWFYVNGTMKLTKFLFPIPQKTLYSEFGFCEFQFLKAPSLCAFFISTRQFY